jgi:hypothetical protein
VARIVLIGLAIAALVGGVVVWQIVDARGEDEETDPLETFARQQRAIRPALIARPDGKPTVGGRVFDAELQEPVTGDADVVLRDAGGTDTVAKVSADGRFEAVVAPGRYRVFVRSSLYISVGMQERIRIDDGPSRLPRGVDAGLMPALDVSVDLRDLELAVVKPARVEGIAYDPDGRPIADAIVRVRVPPTVQHVVRPVLGSDVATTDEDGRFELRVPAGQYVLEATHAKYAGLQWAPPVTVTAGGHQSTHVSLVRGCVIEGRVVDSDGIAGIDGALERDDELRASGFTPAGRVESDGTFRWSTTAEQTVTLRAWPWKTAPSEGKTFNCRDGKRFKDVVLEIPEHEIDVGGTVTDAAGKPVPFAFVDIRALDIGRIGQQERADALGEWWVFALAAGRYKVIATAPGRGVANMTIEAPRMDVQLELSGTGRIAGTTTDLASGSIEVTFKQCGTAAEPIGLAPESRIVPVIGGRFSIEGAPACALTFVTRWRGRATEHEAIVEPNRTSYIEVALGEPREKIVTGTVRGKDRKPVANARVTAVVAGTESATVRTDSDGRYSLKTRAGAELVAGNGRFSGNSYVGRANVREERVDLILEDFEP